MAAAGLTQGSGLDQLGEVVADLLVTIEDQALLGGEVVVDGGLGDPGGFGDIDDGDVLVAALGEQPCRGSAISWRVRCFLRSRSPRVSMAPS